MDGQIRNPPTAPSHLLHTTVRCLLQCKCVTKTLEGSANKHKIAAATVPGQIVLVDQMQSTVPGVVGHIKEYPPNNSTIMSLYLWISSVV
jgi:hypothetical protein